MPWCEHGIHDDDSCAYCAADDEADNGYTDGLTPLSRPSPIDEPYYDQTYYDEWYDDLKFEYDCAN